MHQKLYSVTLQQLEAFFLSAELESFTKAAARLQMTQSAVSKSVARLERDLGLQLFTRRHREISLTQEGKLLYERWRNPVGTLSDVFEDVLRQMEAPANKLRIGTTNTTDLSRYFWGIMDIFTQRYPETELELDSDTMGGLIRKLADGRLDVVFVPDFMKYRLEQLGLAWKWAAKDEMQVIMSDRHPLAGAELNIREVASLRIAVLADEEYPENERFVAELFRSAGCSARISPKRYQTPESILNFYRGEDGVMLTDSFFKFDERAAGCVRKPVHGFYNGIICGWNPGDPKKIRSGFLKVLD